jgi:hypothetical protein
MSIQRKGRDAWIKSLFDIFLIGDGAVVIIYVVVCIFRGDMYENMYMDDVLKFRLNLLLSVNQWTGLFLLILSCLLMAKKPLYACTGIVVGLLSILAGMLGVPSLK